MSEIELLPGMKPNPGYCPDEAKGKRVRVQLRQGGIVRDVEGPFPPGWAADGKNGCRWSKRGGAFDIVGFQVIE